MLNCWVWAKAHKNVDIINNSLKNKLEKRVHFRAHVSRIFFRRYSVGNLHLKWGTLFFKHSVNTACIEKLLPFDSAAVKKIKPTFSGFFSSALYVSFYMTTETSSPISYQNSGLLGFCILHLTHCNKSDDAIGRYAYANVNITYIFVLKHMRHQLLKNKPYALD